MSPSPGPAPDDVTPTPRDLGLPDLPSSPSGIPEGQPVPAYLIPYLNRTAYRPPGYQRPDVEQIEASKRRTRRIMMAVVVLLVLVPMPIACLIASVGISLSSGCRIDCR